MALVVIPEEAELLIKLLRATPTKAAHLISYASPVTRNMIGLGSLAYLALPDLPEYRSAIPDWLRIEVGILAGRLYFNYEEYESVSEYFRNLDDRAIQDISQREETSGTAGKSSIHGFVLQWLTLRRGGQDISHTPMGYVCQRRALTEAHPFFQAAKAVLDWPQQGPQTARRSGEEASDSEDGASDSDD
jgi:hypothetical protein